MQTDGDLEPDVKLRISKSSQTFSILKIIWKSMNLSYKTKINIFKSIVLIVLLSKSESWKVTTRISQMLEVFKTGAFYLENNPKYILAKYHFSCWYSKKHQLQHFSTNLKEKMDLDWSRHQNATKCKNLSGLNHFQFIKNV